MQRLRPRDQHLQHEPTGGWSVGLHRPRCPTSRRAPNPRAPWTQTAASSAICTAAPWLAHGVCCRGLQQSSAEAGGRANGRVSASGQSWQLGCCRTAPAGRMHAHTGSGTTPGSSPAATSCCLPRHCAGDDRPSACIVLRVLRCTCASACLPACLRRLQCGLGSECVCGPAASQGRQCAGHCARPASMACRTSSCHTTCHTPVKRWPIGCAAHLTVCFAARNRCVLLS